MAAPIEHNGLREIGQGAEISTHTYHDQRRTAFVERPNAFIPKHLPDDHERVLGRCGTTLVPELDSRFGKLKGILPGTLISGDFSLHGNGDGWGGAYGCYGLDATGHTASDEGHGRRHWCILGGHRPVCITEAFDIIAKFVQLDGLYPMTSSISRL